MPKIIIPKPITVGIETLSDCSKSGIVNRDAKSLADLYQDTVVGKCYETVIVDINPAIDDWKTVYRP